MNKSEENLVDVEIILEEIGNFLGKEPGELLEHFKYNRTDALCSLPHPKGRGHIICGRKAFDHFTLLAQRYLKSHKDKAHNIEPSEFTEEIKKHFVWKFLIKPQEISEGDVNKMLSSAYRSVEDIFDSFTHYIPCSIAHSSDPNEVSIGSVTFFHKSQFEQKFGNEINSQREIIANEHINHCKGAIAESKDSKTVATEEMSYKLANMLVDDLQSFYSTYDWVASVTIEKCSKTISQRRALLAVEAALNIIKLILGEYHSNKMRTGYSSGLPPSSAKLNRSISDNKLHVSISKGYDGNVLGDNWHQALINGPNEYFFRTAELTINTITNPVLQMPLCQKFLDALTWFGDAVTEQSPAAKVIKYVSAIESIIVTGKEFDENHKEKIRQIVLQRSSMLLSQVFKGSSQYWQSELDQIYACRSDLLHGSISPFHEAVSKNSSNAEFVAGHVLLAGLDFFKSLGLEKNEFSTKRLKKAYRNFEEFLKSDEDKKDKL